MASLPSRGAFTHYRALQWAGVVAMGVCCWSFIMRHSILSPYNPKSSFLSTSNNSTMSSSSACIWLHGLGDNGPNNAPLQASFISPEFRNMKWLFPSAPSQRVTCNYGASMPAWFDIQEIPITAVASSDEEGLTKAVKRVHEMLDKEVQAGIGADKIFLCGFSQGGALSIASALLYPKTLAGASVFSGWVPFTTSFLERATQEGKQTPLLWLHGMNDPVVNFEAGQAGPPLLSQHGVNCEFKAFPGLGHNISPAELACLDRWMKTRIATFVS